MANYRFILVSPIITRYPLAPEASFMTIISRHMNPHIANKTQV